MNTSQIISRLSNCVLPSVDIIIIMLNFPRSHFPNKPLLKCIITKRNIFLFPQNSCLSCSSCSAFLKRNIINFMSNELDERLHHNTILKNNKLNYQRLHLNSYHLISKLTIISKLIESIIIPQLINYITTLINSILHLNQSSLIVDP